MDTKGIWISSSIRDSLSILVMSKICCMIVHNIISTFCESIHICFCIGLAGTETLNLDVD